MSGKASLVLNETMNERIMKFFPQIDAKDANPLKSLKFSHFDESNVNLFSNIVFLAFFFNSNLTGKKIMYGNV